MAKPIKSELLSAFGIAFGIWKSLVDAVKNEGGGDEELRRIEQDEGLREQLAKLIVGEKKADPILQLMEGMIEFPGSTEPFLTADHFKLKQAGIVYLGDNFKSWLLDKREEPIGPTELRRHQLLKFSLDTPIIQELGGQAQAETTLQEIFFLMAKQANGKDGVLLTNGYVNIFYVRRATGGLCAVYVYWLDDGWSVDARSVTYPNEWLDGNQVFSRNS